MIWLIGSGPMAQDYIKVLQGMNKEFLVIGRGETSAKIVEEKFGVKVILGGLAKFLSTNPILCSHAIIATGVEQLYDCGKMLIEFGIKNILTEKPGGLNREQIGDLAELVEKNEINMVVGYNRRFYASVLKAQEIIEEDGGVLSFNFEFTEWAHEIEKLHKPKEVFENWLLANSSHVIDLAFYLGGWPVEMKSFTAGADRLKWHPSASIYAGAGISDKGALFSYCANWNSPGRWSVEVLTAKHRLIFRPMEQLHIQKLASVKIEPVEIDNELDTAFKLGLYVQVQSFIENDLKRFDTIETRSMHMNFFEQISL